MTEALGSTINPCETVNASKLAGLTCVRGGVTFAYGESPVTATGIDPSKVVIVADPNGPNATLVGSSDWPEGWAVGAGETMTLLIEYTVTAPVGEIGLSQIGAECTGDGTILAMQFAGDVSSSISCTAEECPLAGRNVKFSPGTVVASLSLTMSGGTNGSAKLKELSQHVI